MSLCERIMLWRIGFDGFACWTIVASEPLLTVAPAPADGMFLPPPRSRAEKTYDIVHRTEMQEGGHFGAPERPELMPGDLRPVVATVSGGRP